MLEVDEVGGMGDLLAFAGSFNIDGVDERLDSVVVVMGAEAERDGRKDEGEEMDAAGGNADWSFLSTEVAVNNRERGMSQALQLVRCRCFLC